MAVLWHEAEIGLALVARDGTWLRANRRLTEILEYTEPQLMARTFQELTHPGDVRDDQDMVDACLAGHIDRYVIWKRYITRNNAVKLIKLRVNRIDDQDGQFLVFLSQITPAPTGPPATRQAADAPTFLAQFSGSLDATGEFVGRNWKWLAALCVVFLALTSGTADDLVSAIIERFLATGGSPPGD